MKGTPLERGLLLVMERDGIALSQCRPCRRFFSRRKCIALVNTTCECPKCKGTCRCGARDDDEAE